MARRSARSVMALAALCLALAACAPQDEPVAEPGDESDQPPTDPSGDEPADDDGDPPDAEPGEPPEDEVQDASLDERITLRVGQAVRVEDVRITLIEAEGAADDCSDCPLRAVLEVAGDADSQQLSFRFSGNMAPEASEAARTEEAFGYRLQVMRIVDDEVDVTIASD